MKSLFVQSKAENRWINTQSETDRTDYGGLDYLLIRSEGERIKINFCFMDSPKISHLIFLAGLPVFELAISFLYSYFMRLLKSLDEISIGYALKEGVRGHAIAKTACLGSSCKGTWYCEGAFSDNGSLNSLPVSHNFQYLDGALPKFAKGF